MEIAVDCRSAVVSRERFHGASFNHFDTIDGLTYGGNCSIADVGYRNPGGMLVHRHVEWGGDCLEVAHVLVAHRYIHVVVAEVEVQSLAVAVVAHPSHGIFAGFGDMAHVRAVRARSGVDFRILESNFAARTVAVNVSAGPVVLEGGTDGGGTETGIARMSEVLDGVNNLTGFGDNRYGHSVAASGTIRGDNRLGPGETAVKRAAHHDILFTGGLEGSFVGEIALQFARGELKEYRFPTAVFPYIVAGIDCNRFAPCFAVVGAASKCD